MRRLTTARSSKSVGDEGDHMAAIKRTLSRFRRGSDDEEPEIVVDGPGDIEAVDERESVERFDEAETTTELGDQTVDVDETDVGETDEDGPGRPTVWIGLAVASLGGLGAAVYKLFKHRKAAKAAKAAAKEEPWRVEDEPTETPDGTGTASLVGFVFVTVASALGKRFDRDSWE